MEITYSTGTYYDEAETLHRWFAIEDGERVGELYVSMATSVIMNIEVNADRQGEGIARALYEAATAQMTIKHAPVWACTPEGAAFAEAMGGEVATDEDMAAMGVVAPDMMEVA
jgi:hypothetical protein